MVEEKEQEMGPSEAPPPEEMPHPSILIGPLGVASPPEYRRCLIDCLHMDMGKVWELISVFKGVRSSRVCTRIFENNQDPISVVARIRQWLEFVGLRTLCQQVRGQLCFSKHKVDPILPGGAQLREP